jgi:hypothetical protein
MKDTLTPGELSDRANAKWGGAELAFQPCTPRSGGVPNTWRMKHTFSR